MQIHFMRSCSFCCWIINSAITLAIIVVYAIIKDVNEIKIYYSKFKRYLKRFIGKFCVYIKINDHLKIEIQQILILSYCNSNIYFADTFQETAWSGKYLGKYRLHKLKVTEIFLTLDNIFIYQGNQIFILRVLRYWISITK